VLLLPEERASGAEVGDAIQDDGHVLKLTMAVATAEEDDQWRCSDLEDGRWSWF
jgi:hypothetical protein